jgi:hypothetical protein
MSNVETEYLDNLRKHASDTRAFLSNKAKPERERSVCRAFLRTIGVKFDESELIAPTQEPADVAFRTARFQIREILDLGRRRGDDWKNKEKKYTEVNSIADLSEPYSPPTAISFNILISQITNALSEKHKKYGAGCNEIDALVYVNLLDRYLATQSELPNMDKIYLQGWRSVSFLFPPYGVILFAKPTAPDFLVSSKLRRFMEWEDIFSLFEPA